MMKLDSTSGIDFKAVWWGGGIEPLPEWLAGGATLDLAYTVRSRDYQGEKEVQIEWLEAHPVEGEQVEIVAQRREIEVIDHRRASAPMMVLQNLVTGEERLLIWAEAEAKGALADRSIKSSDRNTLKSSDKLVIWTTPSGPQEINSVVDLVSPSVVHLFDVDPMMDEMKPFTGRLVGLAKHALRKAKGKVSLSSLAGATAQREETVRAGLQWLAARGYLAVHFEDEGDVCLNEGDGVSGEQLERVEKRLRELLEETAAFRRYYSSAEAAVLILQTEEQKR
jgi:single-stranded-DNA-specific exonuclease